MNDATSFPDFLDQYLRGYRARTRRLSPQHITDQVQHQVRRAVHIMRLEGSLYLHGRTLILMLYYGTTLRAEEICQLTRHGVIDRGRGDMVLELPVADPTPRQVWLDAEMELVMRVYLDRLPPRQQRLFVDDQGHPWSRSQVYQLVVGFRDDDEGSKFEHFFPIYHESDYSVLPTPLRLNSDTHYTGRGVTIAFIDSGFYPHPDLIKPRNRVRKYINVAEPSRDDFALPSDDSWHGMQTSVVAAGNGFLSHGLYKGIAPDADVVLLKVRGRHGIQTRHILDAFEWILRHHREYNIRIVNISLSGDRPGSYLRSALDQAAEAAVQAGIVMVVAAGNAGWEQGSETIRPPASAPSVITVGGLNDNNRLDVNAYEMYWSSYGPTLDGLLKPEIVAPGIWVAAPILPGSRLYEEAAWIDLLLKTTDKELAAAYKQAREAGIDWPESLDAEPVEKIREFIGERVRGHKMVPPYYQHVDGTSFSAPIVCSVIAQMLEANPKLTPARIKTILTKTTDKLFNVPLTRQGNGLIHPRKAVKEAANDLYRTGIRRPNSPYVQGRVVTFYYRDHKAKSVAVAGDFNGWSREDDKMTLIGPDLWSYTRTFDEPASYRYKFVVNGNVWVVDPENMNREPDGFGGVNARTNLLI